MSSGHIKYVGMEASQVPKPAAILDVAKVRKHCSSMLEVVKSLGVGFRPHVKTHKTKVVTELQIGDSTEEAKLAVSTVAEIEHLLPLLETYLSRGRKVNVLYAIPLPPSQVSRIAPLAQKLGPGSLSFIIDHPSQLPALSRFRELAGFPAGIFIKVDTGYHRAGLPASSLNKGGLVQDISRLESQDQVYLMGLYSHSSLSYQGATPREALDSLTGEIAGCIPALGELRKFYKSDRTVTISVGASPQANSMRSLLDNGMSESGIAAEVQGYIRKFSSGEIEGMKVSLEVHAGVYSIMDLQQLATRARESFEGYEDEIALSVVAEVVSVYNDGERQQPEVLVAVGTLGLGREPCHNYRGWGVVSSRSSPRLLGSERRLIVDRISQEHSILAWEVADGENKKSLPTIPLEVGQSVFIYPNHACVTGAMYRSYFVVDSAEKGAENRIQAVWNRAIGW
ncbi:putative serine dehydratase domain-containing protein [Cadophora sp. MPI-SDFR-AT-0126]|nr:putative serine dehydratase domain-containing protein [Leotiomycetes sp. MPI-SDFR-AT-0126]